MAIKLLIFDFDGVIADSEKLACGIAAAYATDLGAPLSFEDGLKLFMGKRVADVADIVAERGGIVPINFADELQERTLQAFAIGLKPVPGIEAFLSSHDSFSQCIASSSSHRRLAASLRILGLSKRFTGKVFSVDDVPRGKPFPDVFLWAAKVMNVKPLDTLVIEDSVGGVKAGIAAGMRVIGLLAGSHVSNDHGKLLTEAGATVVVATYADLTRWMAQNDGLSRIQT